MARLLATLTLVGALLSASPALAGEEYAPLLRDLDRVGLLEELAARAIATQWSAARAIVPEKLQPQLVDPLVSAARANLSRAETVLLVDDLLSLHEAGAVEPQLKALLAALDHGGPAAEKLEALAGLIPLAGRAGVPNVAALAEGVAKGLDAAPLTELIAQGAALPGPTWQALEEIARKTLDAGAARRVGEFLRSGTAPGFGLEPLREGLPLALCSGREPALTKLDQSSAYVFSFVDSHPEPLLLISFVQWLAAQLDDAEYRQFVSASLSYPRLAQLAAGLRAAIEKDALKEVLLDYADFLAGTDERVRVEPELWKHLKDEAKTPPGEGGLSSVDLVKLGALTLFTVHRLDDIPSAPRDDGHAQTLSDELLDFADFQLKVLGKKSAVSPLFDAVREFLTPSAQRQVLVKVARQFAGFLLKNDPAPLLEGLDAILGCDPRMQAARGTAALFDEDPGNGDARPLTPLVKPFALSPGEPLVPLVALASRTRAPARKLAPALQAALEAEKESRVLSTFALGLGEGEPTLLEGLDPFARGVLAQAGVFRSGFPRLTEERLTKLLAWSRKAVVRDKRGRSDLSRVLEALVAWAKYKNTLSDRTFLADGAVLGAESIRSGLVRTVLDAGVALRREGSKHGVERFLATLRSVLEEKSR